jgi:murein DD-endopeptidase MepM/ murein hydrolase activator NlpD
VGILAVIIAGSVLMAQATPFPRTGTTTVEASPGTLVRWSVPGTKRCAIGKRSWAAVQESCYYPIDLEQAAGTMLVRRYGAGAPDSARITVQPAKPEKQEIVLEDIPQAHPSSADRRRNARDQALVAKLWTKREGPARFTLPLTPPASPLPDGKGFGSLWMFNNPLGSSELHTGVDYALATGTPLKAVADGTVAIAEDLFFAGKAILIDHGNGLVSMYFHLSELQVQAGQDVKRGETIGLVGSTGRVTGPHLHLGIRWHGLRVDPQMLFEDPAKILAVSQ